ncbi:MAG TPA: hypothetical protein VK627_11125 [Edaphobacter sp.]|jgi:hypothetical protein|nr:hypothetical protein [Edaphobacter sp.]
MLFTPLITLLALALPPQPQPAASTLSSAQLIDTARKLAHDEGWPIDQKIYTFDPMKPDVDDGFDSIGLYKKAHLVRMYSIERTTGDIVDFMRGCNVFEFSDVQDLQNQIRKTSGASSLPIDKLAAKVGCSKLFVVRNRWVQ